MELVWRKEQGYSQSRAQPTVALRTQEGEGCAVFPPRAELEEVGPQVSQRCLTAMGFTVLDWPCTAGSIPATPHRAPLTHQGLHRPLSKH